MENEKGSNMKATYSKPGRNQFKCFHCRLVFSAKEGDWYTWNTIEVHLCNNCEKLTKAKPERRSSS